MLRNTPEDHPDNEKLKNAIPLMQSVADYINKDIKEAANMKKFLELSSQGAKVCMGFTFYPRSFCLSIYFLSAGIIEAPQSSGARRSFDRRQEKQVSHLVVQ